MISIIDQKYPVLYKKRNCKNSLITHIRVENNDLIICNTSTDIDKLLNKVSCEKEYFKGGVYVIFNETCEVLVSNSYGIYVDDENENSIQVNKILSAVKGTGYKLSSLCTTPNKVARMTSIGNAIYKGYPFERTEFTEGIFNALLLKDNEIAIPKKMNETLCEYCVLTDLQYRRYKSMK